MKPHGGYKPPRLSKTERSAAWGSPAVRGYRNLFGTAAPHETYRGYLDEADGDRRTEALLDRIAERMAAPYPWPEPQDGFRPEDNPGIPSGYVYLAQLVGHDLSFLGSTFPSINDALLDQQNLRTIALNLDTVYGGGPLDKPFAYQAPERPGQPRLMLRLGTVGSGPDAADTNPAVWERDLPRIGCPHLNGQSGHAGPGLTDVLIADPRNDAQPMVAQILTLFHMLHNAVLAQLTGGEKHDGSTTGREVFARARAIVTYVYGRIIRRDLLPRLLAEPVQSFYEANPDTLLEKTNSTAMPVEFSHAAFRCGHVMLRPAYQFNHDHLFGLRDLLQTNSAALPESMPLDAAWLIDWSLFFELGSVKPNLSRRIGPYYIPFLFDQRSFGTRDGAVKGLPHRDLLRGASIQMRSVSSLIAKIPHELREPSPILRDGAARQRAILDWLTAGPVEFSEEDKRTISEDPPLLLFLLLEAAETQGGERLGILGSIIVAEVVYRALSNVSIATETQAWAGIVFGGETPGTMPDLIGWLTSHYHLDGPDAGFVASEQRSSTH